MKIVNGKKFLRMIVLIIGLVIVINILNTNNSYSKGEIKTKSVYVSNGDTLWNIASYEQENNEYYQNKDVRQIVDEIKELNNIDNSSNLVVGQKLDLYTF